MKISKDPVKSVQDKIRGLTNQKGMFKKCSCGKPDCGCSKKVSSMFGKKGY